VHAIRPQGRPSASAKAHQNQDPGSEVVGRVHIMPDIPRTMLEARRMEGCEAPNVDVSPSGTLNARIELSGRDVGAGYNLGLVDYARRRGIGAVKKLCC
jgi:hypothetical protein